jgi:hypothetical protein
LRLFARIDALFTKTFLSGSARASSSALPAENIFSFPF